MLEYFLSKQEGKIMPRSSEEDGCQIKIMSTGQFHEQTEYPHHEVLEKSLRTARYCKVEIFAECVQGTIRIPGKGAAHPSGMVFGFYLNQEKILLIGEEQKLAFLIEQMRRSVRGCFSPRHFLLLLLEFLIEEDVLYLQEMEERIGELEENLLERIPRQFDHKIISCRKEINLYHAYYEQLMNLSDQVEEFLSDQMSPEEVRAWQMYEKRTERLHNHVEMLREYVVQIRELYQSRIDMEQNRVMTLLTVVTTIFMPLTLIAGWYGMNFSNIPVLNWEYGYPVIITVSLLTIIAEVIYFKKKKML